MKRIAWFLLLALFSGPGACSADVTATASKPAPATTAAATTAASRPVLEEMPYPIAFESTKMTLKGKVFTVELAVSEAQIQRGLMYRDSMPDDHGMLFILPNEDNWSFWMHNTRIPLDIIYLDKAGKVVDIHDRKPLDDTGMKSKSPALFVIELNAGMSKKIGLQVGDTVEIPKKTSSN